MELVHQLEPQPERSALAAARIKRKLTVDQVSRRAGLAVEQVEWLEEGRVYRFPSPDRALLAVLLYGTALGIDAREARELAGLPVGPQERFPTGRVVAGVSAVALLGLLLVTLLPGLGFTGSKKAKARPSLPPWRISVDVLNGGGDYNYTRTLASRIGALGYRIERVTKAGRFDYPSTAVYYEPGGAENCGRLADQLRVDLQPLPGGTNARRCVVIAGPPSGP
jgi:transcriptional regulator with XRE-family HTH domain